MFSHIMIGTNDLDRAKSFYDALLGTLGVPPARVDGHRIFYMTPGGVFSVSKPINGEPATAPNGGTIGFAANGIRPEWPTAPRPARIRLACGRGRWESCTWPTCGTRTGTSCALCIG